MKIFFSLLRINLIKLVINEMELTDIIFKIKKKKKKKKKKVVF